MQLLTASTLFVLGFLQSPVMAAFKASPCEPAATAFSLKSPGLVECQLMALSVKGSYATYQCGLSGSLLYDFADNKLQVDGAILPTNGQFTIHGSCVDGRQQVAHLDLCTPRTAYQKFSAEFHGLNRVCNLADTSLKLKFWTYALNLAQFDECAKHPVKQI